MKSFITILGSIIFLFLIFSTFLIKTTTVFAQESPSTQEVNVSAQVLANLSVELNYPKDGSFYFLSNDENLNISGFTNILDPLISLNLQEIRINDIKYNFQFLPDQFGNWQWSAPSQLSLGIYRLNIMADNSFDGLRTEKNLYLVIDDPSNPIFSHSHDYDSLHFILEKGVAADETNAFGHDPLAIGYENFLHFSNTDNYLIIINNDS